MEEAKYRSPTTQRGKLIKISPRARDQAPGRYRGGLTTKVHTLADALDDRCASS
jgi:hypothetical protein